MNLNYSSLVTSYEKFSICGKVLFLLSLFFIVVVYFKKSKNVENFESRDKFQFLTKSVEIYDDFYADIYDRLVFNRLKNDYEIAQIRKLIDPATKTKILDIGCGTGHHVAKLSYGDNTTIIGIDQSSSMVKKSQQNYPSLKFEVKDATDTHSFISNSFTHILVLYFTIYYFERKDLFLTNCMDWLMPGVRIVLHLVDKQKFDPMIPSGNPLYVVSPQKYAPKRITKTKVTFNNFIYNSNFKTDQKENISIFEEKFTFPTGHSRKQEHSLFIEDTEKILKFALDLGFIIEGKINLAACGYEFQYLYVLGKPQ